MSQAFDLIVFDWDGTLMDSTAHIAQAIQRACGQLGEPIPSREAASHVIGLGLREALLQACPTLPPARYPELADAYRQQFVSQDEVIELFAGVREGLAALENAGYMLAVATGKSRRGLDHALQETGLGHHFITTRTADECPSKPHPQMLLEICDFGGCKPARTLMVGDTSHDMLLARHAGASALAVSYGAHDSETLASFDPLKICDRFEDVYKWLIPNC